MDASVVCIDVSDTDEENTDDWRDDVADSFEFEPDAEPPFAPPAATASVEADLNESLGGVILPSDAWELVLVLDHREILSRQNRDVLERKLLERNVTCEVRALNVGDMQWVARRFRGDAVDGASVRVCVCVVNGTLYLVVLFHRWECASS